MGTVSDLAGITGGVTVVSVSPLSLMDLASDSDRETRNRKLKAMSWMDEDDEEEEEEFLMVCEQLLNHTTRTRL